MGYSAITTYIGDNSGDTSFRFVDRSLHAASLHGQELGNNIQRLSAYQVGPITRLSFSQSVRIVDFSSRTSARPWDSLCMCPREARLSIRIVSKLLVTHRAKLPIRELGPTGRDVLRLEYWGIRILAIMPPCHGGETGALPAYPSMCLWFNPGMSLHNKNDMVDVAKW